VRTMAINRFNIKQDDLKPNFMMRLLAGETPIDLTLASQVRFYMGNRSGLVVEGDMIVHDQSVDISRGIVEYAWRPGDTDDLLFQITTPTVSNSGGTGLKLTSPLLPPVTVILESRTA